MTKFKATRYIGIGVSLYFLYSCRKHLITRNKLYMRILDLQQIEIELIQKQCLYNNLPIINISNDEVIEGGDADDDAIIVDINDIVEV
tara:strand:+ start:141 stop:404 length:264 start_codon:yes stop_codon:yes gene_type:complete